MALVRRKKLISILRFFNAMIDLYSHTAIYLCNLMRQNMMVYGYVRVSTAG